MALVRGYVDRTIPNERAGEVLMRSIMYWPWSEAIRELLGARVWEQAASDPE
jgi:hypothetical protein